MAVLTRNNSVTNGLVLNLDSLNPQSIPVDPTMNLKNYSQDFTAVGGGYVLGATTSTTGSFLAPDGTNTATLITEDTTNNIHRIYYGTSGQSPSINLQQNKYYTVSFYAKNNGRPVSDSILELPSGRAGVTYNLSTGTLVNYTTLNGVVLNSSIDSVGNGWYRISYTTKETASIAAGAVATIARYYNENNSGSYTGNGLSGSYIWGYQLEQNNYATPYFRTFANPAGRTSWYDLSGNNNITTLYTSSVSSSIPKYNYLNERVLNFDGTGSYAAVTSSWSYLSSSAIETVFSINSFGTSEVTSIGGYDQKDGSFFARSVAGMIYIDNIAKNIGASVITLTQNYRSVGSSTIINTGSYYHVILNKDTTLGTLQIYINGVLQGTNTFDTSSYAQWFSTGSYQGSDIIRISNTLSGNVAAWSSKYLNGKIPVFKLYNRTLTQAEVTQNYNVIKTRFNLI